MKIIMEKRRLTINALSNGVAVAVKAAVTFFVQPFLVHSLGDERFGIWLLVSAIIGYMAIGDLGIGAAVLRFVSRFDGQEDTEGINRVFSTSLAVFGVIGFVLMAVTWFLALAWSRPLGVEQDLAGDTRWLLVLLGTQFAVNIPVSVYLRLLEGLGHYPVRSAINIGGILLRNALFVAVILGGGGLVAIGLVICICSTLEQATSIVLAHRLLPSLKFSTKCVTVDTLRTIWAYSVYVFTANTAWRAAGHTIPIILNVFLGPAAITYYGIASTLNSKGGELLYQMMGVLTPAVSKWEGAGNHRAIQSLLLLGTRYVLYLAIPVQVGLILFGRPFLSLWMGERYAELAYPTLAILAMSLPLEIARNLSSHILKGVGKVGWLALLAVVRGAATIVLAILMAYSMGLEGVASAISVVAALIFAATTVLICRVTATRFMTLLGRAYVKPVVFAMALLPPWIAGQHALPPTGWAPMILVGSMGLLVYGTVVVLGDRGVRENTFAFLRGLRQLMMRRHEDLVVATPHPQAEMP